MKKTLKLLESILLQDSTSGHERALGEWLLDNLDAPHKTLMEVGDGTVNLLLSWGTPKLVYCTHMDTVPPYIPPVFDEHCVRGRGSCDAKGQLVALYAACKELERKGKTDFGLLVLSGEETGSWGAKAFARTPFKAPYLVIGEPTENHPVSASKGTKSFAVRFKGKAFHSGYPQYGVSAVDLFVDFVNRLRDKKFPVDEMLGETTWNIGLLHGDNQQNILSPELWCRIYFRTTFASDAAVGEWMAAQACDSIEIAARGGDSPSLYVVPEGLEGRPVAFGSDAPHLSNFEHKIICGPGSITCAHRDDEHLDISELEEAIRIYVNIFENL